MTKFAQDVEAISSVIDDYRKRIADYEQFVTKLYGLLAVEKHDEVMDLVRHEYIGIHGPNG